MLACVVAWNQLTLTQLLLPADGGTDDDRDDDCSNNAEVNR